MTKKFTYMAQKALNLAKEYAADLGHNYVGTEHLLLALISVNDCVASKILVNNGLTKEEFKKAILSYNIASTDSSKIEELVVTPRMTQIMQSSIKEANNFKTEKIGTEILLFSIIVENDTVAFQILEDLDISTEDILSDIIDVVNEGQESYVQNTEMVDERKTKGELIKFAKDMTQYAKLGAFDPIIGRENEIERVMHILARRMKNNPVLTGEPGVGKTAIVEGIAQKIASGDCPEIMKNKRIFSLDIAAMIAGAKYRGEFEERLKKSLEEVRANKNIILFVDEMHNLIGAGNSEGSVDAANILKPYLARGEIQLIGATTINEYRKYIEKDSAFERRFAQIQVSEPKGEELYDIIEGIKGTYEKHHNVSISKNTVKTAIMLSERYIADRMQPDKTIDLIDEASARVRLMAKDKKSDEKTIAQKLNVLRIEKDQAIDNQDLDKASEIREKEKRIYKDLYTMNINEKRSNTKTKRVTPEHIREIISIQTKIPIDKISDIDKNKLSEIDEILKSRIIGQNDAVSAVSKAVKRSRVGLKDPKKPIGSFLFLGPTGVGKTELAKSLAYALFNSEKEMIRLDMSEYMEKHTVSKLIGSPPGYVGHDEAGQLTEAVRRKPYSLILFDEIEKAHYDVFNILLQILEDGVLTDSKGRKANFKNCIIVMTSNIGAKNITEGHTLGFVETGNDDKDYKEMEKNVIDELKTVFKPEFLNRIDDVIVFHKLSQKNIVDISKLLMEEFKERVKEQKIRIDFTEELLSYLAKEGFDEKFGARPIKRLIVNKIENKLAEEIVAGKIDVKNKIIIDINNNDVVFIER